MNEKVIYEYQKRQHREKSEEILSLLARRGLVGDMEINDERLRQAQQEKRKQAYHNTQLLLKNYRHIIWQAECETSRIAEELNLPLEKLDAILSRVDAELGMGNQRLEARLESLQKFRTLIDRVNEALTLLKRKPDNGEKLYALIYMTYIAPEKLEQNEILYRLDLSRRHYYRLREQAISVMSLRLWAAPTSELDIWLELLMLLEGEI